MLSLLLIAIGVLLLVKGADWLVRGASSLAGALGVSQLTIGLTVVAFGTSTPELVVSLMAALGGNSDIALGNVLGSNTANVLLILGVAAVICPLAVTVRTVRIELPLCLLAGIAAGGLLIDGRLGRGDGLLLLLAFTGFMIYIRQTATRPGANVPTDTPPEPATGRGRAILQVLAGLAALVGGGKAVVSGAVSLAAWLGLSESLVGLTVVAVGTSLPELATSVVAAYRRNTDIAVGNVVGSNIFNVFFVLATTVVVGPLTPPPMALVDAAVATGAAALLLLSMWSGRKYLLERWEGAVFLAAYAAYIVYLALRG